MQSAKILKSGIIGTGKIGCDLLMKVLNHPGIDCEIFLGRNKESEGLKFAQTKNVATSDAGVKFLHTKQDHYFDIIFDATSAQAHENNIALLKSKAKKVINLTPAKSDAICVPSINPQDLQTHSNVSFITCGAQASLPIATALSRACEKIEYIESVASIASSSAGLATRKNIEYYLEATEKALIKFTKCKQAKSIFVVNPAEPEVYMQVTLYALTKGLNVNIFNRELEIAIANVQKYLPGYELLSEPIFDNECITILLKIIGNGDYLPSYAGNLDIITSAAVYAACQ